MPQAGHALTVDIENTPTDPARTSQPADQLVIKRAPTSLSSRIRAQLTPDADYIVIALVGLPARGKSFISKKLERYLIWRGDAVRIFNVGERRREKLQSNGTFHDASFFSVSNLSTREELAQGVLIEMMEWLRAKDGGATRIAIFDATNSRMTRRKTVDDTIKKHLPQCKLLFVESVCTEANTLERNLLQKVRNSPDYKSMPEHEALQDLKRRISEYESQYETLSPEENMAYIKLFNLSSQLHLNHIYGRLAKSLVPYMMSIHVGHRPIFLVRAAHVHGASTPLAQLCTEFSSSDEGRDESPSCRQDSQTVVVARSAELSEEGLLFAERLGHFCYLASKEFSAGEEGEPEDCGDCSCAIFTSTLTRAVETASCVKAAGATRATSALNPIDKGVCYELTEADFQAQMPEEYSRWRRDIRYRRFLGGESYHDLIQRLEPLLMELEQQTRPVLVVSHLSTLQVLYSYFTGCTLEDALSTDFPNHHVMQITPCSSKSMWETKLIPLEPVAGKRTPLIS
mmetsp:Transcript_23536/g.56692  ORF Transcript_23536/g.56692 Transcript_23536/m.56692 type:complete len:514 (-) Transcript_23536:806-2347(-)